STFDCLSGVNPCPVNVKSSLTEKSTEKDDQAERFLHLLQETDKPDPWEYLAQKQYADLLSPAESDLLENELIIFPQPASDKARINISIMQGEKVSLRCYDQTGRLVIHEDNIQAEDQHAIIDCRSLKSGIYTVTLNGSSFYVTKMVVIR
ncbi:MAG: T9SS type A sorting domain-containing protein, partial [Bacteroidales bacterium]|nr:T9SS type A sorting domain-containing protein [Bacteroidales bacterium]